MDDQTMLEQIQKLVEAHGLKAEFWPELKRVCVRGDGRAVLPILNLIPTRPLPDHQALEKISTQITNQFNIGSVVLQFAQKAPDEQQFFPCP